MRLAACCLLSLAVTGKHVQLQHPIHPLFRLLLLLRRRRRLLLLRRRLLPQPHASRGIDKHV